MRKTLFFLKRNGLFLCFITLELIAFNLISRQEEYEDVTILSSANIVTGKIYETFSSLTTFFNLKKQNRELLKANKRLKAQLMNIQNSSTTILSKSKYEHLSLISTRVINTTIHKIDNYLTFDKGSHDGIEMGMGVINNGIIGKIKTVSNYYSTAYSLLNSNVLTAAEVRRTRTICVVSWMRNTVNKGALRYIPKHIKLQKGDTVVTSGYNSIFPSNILIGFITKIEISKNQNFQKIEIDFAEDFSKIKYAYIVKNNRLYSEAILESEK